MPDPSPTTTPTINQIAPAGPSRAGALSAQITELCAYLFAAESRLLTLIREFDEHRYWAEAGSHSCAHWLQWKCGIGLNAAREKVRVAHALAGLQAIDQALARGEISYSKVRALTRIATPDNEADLLMIARHGTAHHVEKLVAQARRLERLEDLERANDNHAARSVAWHYDEDGCLVLKARLPAEQGALLVKALDAATEQAFTADDDENVTAVTPGEPIAARRADALASVAETYLQTEPVPASTADRYQVVVHTRPDQEPAQDVTAVTSHIENGPQICQETAERIACDAAVVRVRDDEQGEPLSIGRKTRSIPPPMRRALRLRDGGCRFPGCTHSQFVDGHHIRHWADGGETRLDNLVQLCRHHHRLVHEGGYSCRRRPDGEIVFESPAGQALAPAEPLPSPTPGHDLERLMHELTHDLAIDPDTCVSRWQGERMDWDMALAALLSPSTDRLQCPTAPGP